MRKGFDSTIPTVNPASGRMALFKDIKFPMAPPKTTGAGNPTLTTWNGNLRGFSFAVGDTHDFDPQEYDHDGKENSTGSWHVHFISRTNVAATRGVNWQLEFSQADANAAFPAPTTINIDVTIPANTPVNTHLVATVGTFTTALIQSQMYVKLTRIASALTAPATDPVVIGVHYHYELDSAGSRGLSTK